MPAEHLAVRGADTFLLPADVAVPPSRDRAERGRWTTYFVDLSSNNGVVDLREIARGARRTGITCCELKATEGVSYVNPLYHEWRQECERFGLRSFAYHFARPDLHHGYAGAVAEAAHFCDVVERVESFEWRPMLDYETPPFDAAWVRAWNGYVQKRLGVAPCFYSYGAAIESMHLSRPLGDGLIFAYPNGIPQSAPCPAPWKRWAAHQYSWHGIVAGVNGRVDLNWARSVWTLLADPAKGAAVEPAYRARRRRA